MSEDKNIKIAKLIGLEKKTREAKTEDELNFVIVNETRQLVDYISSFLLLKSSSNNFSVKATSDLATVDRTSPLISYLEKIINHKDHRDTKDIQTIDLEKTSKSLKIKKPKNIPGFILQVPLFSAQQGFQGFLILSKNQTFNENEIDLLTHLANTFGHAQNTFKSGSSVNQFFKKNLGSKLFWSTLILLIIISIVPIKMSSTAPVDVVPSNPKLVTAPFDGVVKSITINNNDKVSAGDLVVLLEDLDLNNEYNLAQQSLQIAEKELLRSRQSSFSDTKEKARIAELAAQVDLKKAELNSVTKRLKNSKIYSTQNGIAIVDRKSEWQGRPVSVGEKIITIANQNEIEFLIWLPVKDSLVIQKNSLVKVFLDINPMKSLEGKLLRASYQPSLSPEGILSYKLTASYEGDANKLPRIGLRGTAKVYGSEVSVFYYLFRKPITFMRQLIGI